MLKNCTELRLESVAPEFKQFVSLSLCMYPLGECEKLSRATTSELRTPNGAAHALAAFRPCSNRDSRVLRTRTRMEEVKYARRYSSLWPRCARVCASRRAPIAIMITKSYICIVPTIRPYVAHPRRTQGAHIHTLPHSFAAYPPAPSAHTPCAATSHAPRGSSSPAPARPRSTSRSPRPPQSASRTPQRSAPPRTRACCTATPRACGARPPSRRSSSPCAP
jgi:hypothetical protein